MGRNHVAHDVSYTTYSWRLPRPESRATSLQRHTRQQTGWLNPGRENGSGPERDRPQAERQPSIERTIHFHRQVGYVFRSPSIRPSSRARRSLPSLRRSSWANRPAHSPGILVVCGLLRVGLLLGACTSLCVSVRMTADTRTLPSQAEPAMARSHFPPAEVSSPAGPGSFRS